MEAFFGVMIFAAVVYLVVQLTKSKEVKAEEKKARDDLRKVQQEINEHRYVNKNDPNTSKH